MKPLIAAGLLTAAVTLAAAPIAAAQGSGPDASACSDPSATSVLVHITGFKSGVGTIRIQAYGSNPDDFLKKGKWLRRIELPLNGRRTLDVCIRLPAPGRYAIAVRHDANDNGQSDWSDGGGFTRNPKLSIFSLKPTLDKVALTIGQGGHRADIVMNYRHGLSIGPEQPGG